MEFNEKLQELRKRKGLTQEELAEVLYVSRTAVSKWESGRGYPNIESLKAISKFFSVTLDELLSSDEILILAEEDRNQKAQRLCDLVYGLLDLSFALLLFFPLFADRTGGIIQGASSLMLVNAELYLKIPYFVLVFGTIIIGIATLALQCCRSRFWIMIKRISSLMLGTLSALLFIVGLHPYAAVFAFALLIIKTIMLVKCK